MPVAEFPGAFGWGYDGVDLFAPSRLYGRPDDFRHSSTAPTRPGSRVILDVVYNHFGPDGNYLRDFAPRLLHRPLRQRVGRRDQLRRAAMPAPVRELVVQQRRATGSTSSISTACGSTPRSRSTTHRPSTSSPRSPRRARRPPAAARSSSSAENEPQNARAGAARAAGRLRPRRACGTTTSTTARAWRSTGRREAYFTDYRGTPQEFVSRGAVTASSSRDSATPGRSSARGTPGRRPAARRVRHFMREPRSGGQHRPRARACTTTHARRRSRAMTALLLLVPGDADAVPGPGVRGSRAVPVLRRPRAGRCATPVREGRARIPAAVRAAARRRRRRRRVADAARPRRRSRGASSTATRARATRRHWRTRCTATCCGCGARMPRDRAPARGVPRRRGARRRRPVVLRYFGRRRRATGCWWSTSARTSTSRPRPSRCWRRRAARAGNGAGRANDPRTAAPGRRVVAPRRWRMPGHAADRAAAARSEDTPHDDEHARRSRPNSAWSGACACVAGETPTLEEHCAAASGWSPTASAGTPPARSPARSPAATTASSSRPCPTPLGRTMMLNHLDGAAALAATARDAGSGPHELDGRLAQAGRRAVPARVPARAGLPVWRYVVDGARIEKRDAHAAPAEHRARHVPAAGGARPCGCAAARRRVPAARGAGRSSAGRGYTRHARGERHRGAPPTSELPPLRSFCTRPTTAFTLRRPGVRDVRYASKSARGLRHAGQLWSPATSALTCDPARPATLIASTEPGNARRAQRRGGAHGRTRARRGRCSPGAAFGARPASAARARAGRRPVPRHARGAGSRRRARARAAATRCERSSPAITGSPTGAATR